MQITEFMSLSARDCSTVVRVLCGPVWRSVGRTCRHSREKPAKTRREQGSRAEDGHTWKVRRCFLSRLFRLLLTTCRLCGAHYPLSNGPSAAAWSHSRVADFMNSYRNAVVSGGGTARARGGRLPRAAFYRGRHCMAKLMNMFVILQVHLDVC